MNLQLPWTPSCFPPQFESCVPQQPSCYQPQSCYFPQQPSCYQPQPCFIPQQPSCYQIPQQAYPEQAYPQQTYPSSFAYAGASSAAAGYSAYPESAISPPQVSVDMPISQSQTSSMALGTTGGLSAISASGINFNYA